MHAVDENSCKALGDLAVADALEEKGMAEEQLARTILRAPEPGIVHELVAHTVGGVVAPGETVMKIIPQSDS